MPRIRRTPRRLTLVAAALPLVTLVGCGQAAQSTRASVQSDLQKASDHLLDSKAMAVILSVQDSKGTLRNGLLADADPPPAAVVDSLLGGTVSVTIDPTGDRTVRDLQKASPSMSSAEQLKAVNASFVVSADGGPVVELRLADGDVYARVDLDRLTSLAAKGGGEDDLSTSLEQLESSAGPKLQPLVTDLKAGRWVKVPLAQYADRLAELGRSSGSPTPTPSVDGQQLSDDLLAAVRPFVQVTDAGGDGGERLIDVRIQAKQALRALLDTLKRSLPAAAGLDQLDSSAADKLRDGTVDGRVTLKDQHLTSVTADLASLVKVAPEDPTVPDLTGSSLKLSVDDSADAVDVPGDVSSYDVGPLLESLLSSVGSAMPLAS